MQIDAIKWHISAWQPTRNWENEFKTPTSLFLYMFQDKASLVRIEQTEYLLH